TRPTERRKTCASTWTRLPHRTAWPIRPGPSDRYCSQQPWISQSGACGCRAKLTGRSVDLGPGLALADEPAERTALQLQRIPARISEIARIGLAVLGIVDLPGPFAGAGRLHAEHDLHAEQRPAALGCVGIVLVGLRFARVRIVRLLQPHDRSAQCAAAIGNADARRAGLGEPHAVR